MEKQIIDMLTKMQSSMEEMNEKLGRVEERLGRVEVRLESVEQTVNRIEATQTEDVVALLKVSKKKTDFEVEYLNNRVTEMDKRIFTLEKRIEN